MIFASILFGVECLHFPHLVMTATPEQQSQLDLFPVGRERGQKLFERIGDCQQRIHEQCDALGIPRNDMMQTLTDCVADMRHGVRRTDAGLSQPESVSTLR